MRLSSIRIQNFRAFSDQTISFNDYTCLVGPNGGGKSTILQALNVFFQESSHSKTDLLRLDAEDFHHKDHSKPVVITLTFENLSPEAQQDFKDYYRHGKLIVSAIAEWNDDDKFAQVAQYGSRLGVEDFKPFFKALGDGEAVKELKAQYAAIRVKHQALPAPGTKQDMIDALHAYEAAHPEHCIEILSEDQFYGVSKGVNRLEKYIQWVFIPAVKDASDEELESKNTALGSLLERTVRTTVGFDEPLEAIRKDAGEKYQKAVSDKQSALAGLEDSLTKKLSQWAHPDTSVNLQWHYDGVNSIKIAPPYAQIIAGEGPFKGKLSRFGHGMQRSFLLALLEELAGGQANGPKLILGCEEPELYQHPPQARHLSSVFQTLATTNSQVIVCTHSPYFISGREVEDVRSIRPDRNGKCCKCYHVTLNDISNSITAARGDAPVKPTGMLLKVQQALQPALNEIFFTKVLLLVEGLEDVAYVTTQMTLMSLWDEFRKFGGHVVAVNGKSSMLQPLAIANHLEIQTFVLFDSDGHTNIPDAADSPKVAQDKKSRRAYHQKDNEAILKLCGVEKPDAFPSKTMWLDRVVMWSSEIGEIVHADIGADDLQKLGDAVRKEHGIDVGGINKDSLFIGYLLAKAWDQGKKSANLEKLCNTILAFARNTAAAKAEKTGNESNAVKEKQ